MSAHGAPAAPKSRFSGSRREVLIKRPENAVRLACCHVRCGRSRCLRSRVRGRDALLSQAFPGVLARSSVWQAAECFAAHCAVLGFAGQMWPVCCQTCMHDG